MTNEITKKDDIKIGDYIKTIDFNSNKIGELKEFLGCPQADEKDMKTFLATCNKYKLNPYLKEIYMVKYKNYKTGGYNPATIILAKSAWLKRALSHPNYDGHDSNCIKEDEEIIGVGIVKLKNISMPITYRAYFSEYNTGKSLWTSHPKLMITKCALVGALREAFPDVFHGLYDIDEMAQAKHEEKEPEKVQVVLKEPVKKVVKPKKPREKCLTIDEAKTQIDGLTLAQFRIVTEGKIVNPVTLLLQDVYEDDRPIVRQYGMDRREKLILEECNQAKKESINKEIEVLSGTTKDAEPEPTFVV